MEALQKDNEHRGSEESCLCFEQEGGRMLTQGNVTHGLLVFDIFFGGQALWRLLRQRSRGLVGHHTGVPVVDAA